MSQSVAPPVTWAQRKNVVFFTICLEDCRSPTLNIESNKIYFKGTGGTEKKEYEYSFNLYGEVDTDKSRSFIRDRNIELVLVKKEEGPFWPHLLKEKKKMHWLKVDFARWKDEDSEDEDGDQNQDLEAMMRQMGGLGGAGGAGLEDRPSLDDLDDEDSDDDDLPDLE